MNYKKLMKILLMIYGTIFWIHTDTINIRIKKEYSKSKDQV